MIYTGGNCEVGSDGGYIRSEPIKAKVKAVQGTLILRAWTSRGKRAVDMEVHYLYIMSGDC